MPHPLRQCDHMGTILSGNPLLRYYPCRLLLRPDTVHAVAVELEALVARLETELDR